MVAIIRHGVAVLVAAGTLTAGPAARAEHDCGRSPDGAIVEAAMDGERAEACETAMDVAVAYQNNFPSTGALADDPVDFTVQVDGAPWECMVVETVRDVKPRGQCVHPSGDTVNLYG
jgi:hypothetical protein